MKLEQLVNSKYSHVVSVEPMTDGSAIIYTRQNDSVSSHSIPFKPFVLMKDESLLDGFFADDEIAITRLKGSAPLSTLVSLADTDQYKDCLKHLKATTGYSPSSQGAPYRVISDMKQQSFISEEFRLFREMKFSDIRRMQFDIETQTTAGFDFPNAQRENDRIIIISMCDSTGWEKCISLDNMTEKELLENFVQAIRERDPDVLEGHNIFKFDLPYIEERAKLHKVKLELGRDGSEIKKRPSRFSAAERAINYSRYQTHGRHIIDTFHLVQLYDVMHRDLESYGLKSVARHFGVAAQDRTYVDGSKISEMWETDREVLLKYALDDVYETRSISDILSPSYFYQAQLIPLSYQNCVVRGNATRIDSMLIACYLKNKTSIPAPEPGRPFSGGLSKAFESGVFKNIWHCDVRSLYPSIILAEKLSPRRDSLKAFPVLLDKLRTFRFEAKDAEKNADNESEKDHFNALQTTFKILINSFYGYLGFGMGTFNDYEMAENVTCRGREILTSMLELLNEKNAKVIEMDTDGLYFQPPSDVTNIETMESMVQSVLPDGIEVELDSTYAAMFSYKSKNYALLKESGEVSIAGAALKSRGLEPFQREYIERLISLLLHEKADEIEALTDEFSEAIQNRTWDLKNLAKRENLNNSIDTYTKKMESGKGRRSAVYELVASSNRTYSVGDQVSYYITGDKKKVPVVGNCCLLADAPEQRNENIAYYQGKLDELYKKFAEFIPESSQSGKTETSGQMTFGF